MPSVLVLEDDATLRELILESLEEEGFRVRGAANAREALALARQGSPDLILADVRMEGMDGIDCLAELARVHPEARRVVITGYADADAPARAIRVEVDDYVHKPFRMHTLLAVVHRVLGAGRERDGYESLLGRIVAGYRTLVEKAGTALVSAKLASLDRSRDQ
ncbi:MAG: response regulator, partial [Candidatus Eremiobacterota bacterium]